MSPRRAASLVALVLVGGAFFLRATVELPDAAPLPQRLVPPLVALAALCAAGILVARAPLAAWLATAVAAGVAAVEILAVGRGLLDHAAIGNRTAIVMGSALAGLAALGIALGYLAAPRRAPERRLVRVVALTVAGVSVAAGLAAAGFALLAATSDGAVAASPSEVSPVRFMNRLLLGSAALSVALGLVRDVGGAGLRAAGHVRAGGADPAGRPSFASALADELLPLRARERSRAAEAERERLAADLHATVLPELRRAAMAAERAGAPPDVAAGLRRSLEGVERLMHERQSIVLEEFGLVAALEWLAEQIEERTDLLVELELEGARVAERDAVPLDVARAAFRIALLALDNVARHADARRATVRLAVTAVRLRLAVVDDGTRDWDPDRPATGRGLPDMRRAAASIGGTLEVGHTPTGSTVALAWPARRAAEASATSTAEVTTRPGAVRG